MPIVRTDNPDGSWTEKATDPKSAKDLMEKHGPGMQKRGAEEFHKSYMRDLSVGFEKVRAPDGSVTHVRADEVGRMLTTGHSPLANPRMVMPELPWPKKHMAPGKHRFRYNKLTGNMEEC